MTALAAPATDRQRAFATDLAEQVFGSDNAPEQVLAWHEAGIFADRKRTSRLIDDLIARRDAARRAPRPVPALAPHAPAAPAAPAPAARRQADPLADVAPGYYAVTFDGTLRFYRVADGKGRWTGRRFLNRYSSDNLLRPSRAEVADVVASILDNPAAAQQTFAAELGRCYACGRTLTDAESRRLGIGPDCRGRRH